MWRFDNTPVPAVRTALPGPKAQALLERDAKYVSPSYTRIYPLVVERGSGCVIEDVDGNLFLDFTAGIAVTAAGHCHPEVVAAIKDQADKLLHMSGTDFYYGPQIDLAERLQEVGAHVVYGVVGYKTHAKMCLVVRREEAGGLKHYAHLGTGNYHPRTARMYTDYGLFTADAEICKDVHAVFLQLTSLGKVSKLHNLLQSPFTLMKGMHDRIERAHVVC